MTVVKTTSGKWSWKEKITVRTVYKFPLTAGETTEVSGGTPRVIHVGVDPSGEQYEPCAWVELDPEGADLVSLTFIGTGHQVPDGCSHVGSVVTPVGLVWHVYVEPNAQVRYVVVPDSGSELVRFRTLTEAREFQASNGGRIWTALGDKVQQ